MTTLLRAVFVGCICALIIAAALASGCTELGAPAVKGSGVVASETRDVADFTDVRVAGSGDVAIEQTGAESLSVEAEDNILPLLETKVEKGVLRLGMKSNVSVHATRPIRYRITVKELTGVGIAGSGSIRATGIDTRRLAADISGSGSAQFDGRADDTDLRISGSGSYDAANLKCRTVRVSISGSGNATVNATDRLEANVSGSGSVNYVGNPSVEKRISGSGSVARR